MPNKDAFGPGFIPDALDRNLNGPGPELGVYIIVPGLAGRLPLPAPRGETIIRFIDQPTLSESRAATYTATSLLHSPEAFSAYEGTAQREFSIEGRFFSQTDSDVEINNQVLHVVRSLVMPDYNGTGAPPTPVKLFAYGTKNIHALPCLVKDYSMAYPNDVDYVVSNQIQGDVTMPVVFTLSMTLSEQHSVSQLREFSLDDFRTGNMVQRGF